jgi:hypothetical protein
MRPSEDERRRLARALWAYSLLDQKRFAEEVGIGYHRVRAVLSEKGRDAPTLDELVVMCDALRVPASFGLDGWGAISQLEAVEARLNAELEALRAEQQEDSTRLTQLEEVVRAAIARDRRAGGEEGPQR